MTPRHTLPILLAACCCGVAPLSPASAADPAKIRAAIATLQSASDVQARALACQALAAAGAAEAVPALAALLPDPQLSAYARDALEAIPAPEASAALRQALVSVRSDQLLGVIDSLGVRKDAASADALVRLATGADTAVARAAVRALGRIATTEAVACLRSLLTSAAPVLRDEAAAACLLAAEALPERRAREALALYDTVRRADVPAYRRAAALRLAIVARKSEGAPLLVEHLASDDAGLRAAALSAARDLASDDLARQLATALERSAPPMQALLIAALRDCPCDRSLDAIRSKTSDRDGAVRLAALDALASIGNDKDAPTLVDAVAAHRTDEESDIAAGALLRMEGASGDAAMLAKLPDAPSADGRIALIRILGDRRAKAAVGPLLREAANPDPKIALVACRALKPIVGPGDLPPLIGLVRTCSNETVRMAAETVVHDACAADTTSGACDALRAELEKAAKPADRCSWVRILIPLGSPSSRTAILATLDDADPKVAANTARNLGRWPDTAPIDDLLARIERGAHPSLKPHLLSAVLQLAAKAADARQAPEATVAGWFARAQPAVTSPEERRAFVAALGHGAGAAFFRLLAPSLEDPALRIEAAHALMKIAPTLTASPVAAEAAAALRRIAADPGDATLRKQAAELARTFPAASSTGPSTLPPGWEGHTNVWRTQDGVILGGSLEGNPRNEFLATQGRHRNFRLKLEYRLEGTNGFVNGGVQFRSERTSRPENEMTGYQADIGAGHSGCLYDESRRNRFLARAPDDQRTRLERPGDWNRYEIVCEGPRIRILLNGETTVDFTESDPAIPQDGRIGLQIHGNSKAVIAFRAIELTDLP